VSTSFSRNIQGDYKPLFFFCNSLLLEISQLTAACLFVFLYLSSLSKKQATCRKNPCNNVPQTNEHLRMAGLHYKQKDSNFIWKRVVSALYPYSLPGASVEIILLLLLTLQPTVCFSLLINFLPFRPFLTQFPSIPPFPYPISFHSALSLPKFLPFRPFLTQFPSILPFPYTVFSTLLFPLSVYLFQCPQSIFSLVFLIVQII
jgi:hypothetical protein